jgi:hypothetical protein
VGGALRPLVCDDDGDVAAGAIFVIWVFELILMIVECELSKMVKNQERRRVFLLQW